jgi:hypothetical protein
MEGGSVTDRSVQVRLDLRSIENGVVCFGSAGEAEYCAVMEVAGPQESLAKLDDGKQEELLAAYAQFLNSLTFPFQLVVQVHPVDLSWYVQRVEERTRTLSPGLVAIARDHACYVQGLTRQRTLLERRIYIIVSWSQSGEEGAPTRLSLSRLLGMRRRGGSAADGQARADTVQRLLSDRCEVMGRQLSRAGLRATRLDDLGLAQLYHVGWAPEMARTQRLRRELGDYTALVVGAQTRSRRDPSSRDRRGSATEGYVAFEGAGGR